MNKTTFKTLLLLSVLFIVSCKNGDKGGEATILKLESQIETITLSDILPWAAELSFTTNAKWSAQAVFVDQEPWFVVDQTQGQAGTHTLTISATTANESDSNRVAVLELKANSQTLKITVIQEPKGMVVVNTKRIKCTSKGGTIAVTIQRNSDYTVVIPDQFASWITQDFSSKVMQERVEKFSIKQTESEFQSRDGFILFYVQDKVDTAYVEQTSEIKVVNNTTPGDIDKHLTEKERQELTQLKITGVMNLSDFQTISYIVPLKRLYINDLDLEVLPSHSFWFGGISEVILPIKLKKIEDEAFRKSRITSPVMPQGLESIGNKVFFDCNKLTGVTIPSSVTEIGDSAFFKTNLAEVIIPDGVVDLGGSIFAECANLQSVVMGNSVKILGKRAFLDCPKLKSVTLSDGLTTIQNSTFKNCRALTAVELPQNLETIQDSVFNGCGALSTIDLPEKLTSIGVFAFSSCVALNSVDLPLSLTRIGANAFSSCNKLKSLTIPKNVTDIGERALSDCSLLMSVTLPPNLQTIESGLMSGCSSLLGVIIPQNVRVIEDNAFRGCSSLESITIPESVVSIGGGAFESTDLLNNISLLAVTPPALAAGDRPFGTVRPDRQIRVPASSLQAYKTAPQWSYYASEMVAI